APFPANATIRVVNLKRASTDFIHQELAATVPNATITRSYPQLANPMAPGGQLANNRLGQQNQQGQRGGNQQFNPNQAQQQQAAMQLFNQLQGRGGQGGPGGFGRGGGGPGGFGGGAAGGFG